MPWHRTGLRFAALPRLSVALAAAGLVLAVAACAPAGRDPSPPASACEPLTDRDDNLAAIFGDAPVCLRTETISDQGERWTVQTIGSTEPGPLWILPHDDENAALVTAAASQARYGGTIVAIDTGGRRLNGRIDPNRAFGRAGERCPTGGAAPRWTAAVLRERHRGYPVVALHTNRPGIASRGGAGTISIAAVPDDAEAFRPPAGVTPLGGDDDLVIVAARNPARDRRLTSDVRRLNAAGINVMVETVGRGRTDCSLSHYAASNGIGPYYNVEVRDGNAALQTRMVAILMGIAGVSPKAAG